MKKALAVVLVVMLSVGSLFAASDARGASKEGSFGVGANLGTDLGVYLDWGMGMFDLDVIAGFYPGLFSKTIGVFGEVGANFAVVDFADVGDFAGSMPLSVGGAGLVAFQFGSIFDMSVEVLVPLKLEYTFPKVPVSLFLRLAPGLGFYNMVHEFGINFAFQGSIGATYNF